MKKKWILRGAIALAACGAILACLHYHGMLLLNYPSARTYPVHGVDVSAYQGEIDWDVLANQGIQFAFVKATEGSSHVDAYYAANEENARRAGLRMGAYHFFSYDSPGATQAQNFISVVSKADDMLPPVADVEFYGDKENNPPPKEHVVKELSDFLDAVGAHYQKRPVIYATHKSYALYIAGNFPDCDIWIRDVFFRPTLPDQRDWTFWQYADSAILDGYAGPERFIDMNVFYGSREEFARYAM